MPFYEDHKDDVVHGWSVDAVDIVVGSDAGATLPGFAASSTSSYRLDEPVGGT